MRLTLVVSLIYILMGASGNAETALSVHSVGDQPFQPVFELETAMSVHPEDGTPVSRESTQFRLPNDAHQGSVEWYILDVILKVEFVDRIDPAAIDYVSVATNDATAAQLKFRTIANTSQPMSRWSTLELFSGGIDGTVTANTATYRFQNYLQFRGVKPGSNNLSLQLERTAGAVVRSAELVAGSTIARGPVPPADLRVDLTAEVDRASVGSIIPLHYHIDGQGLPIREVNVVVHPSGFGVAPIDSWERTHRWVTVDEGLVDFIAIEPGLYEFTVTAKGSTGGTASSVVSVRVEQANNPDGKRLDGRIDAAAMNPSVGSRMDAHSRE